MSFGTFTIGEQLRLRWVCAVLPEPYLLAHTRMEVDEASAPLGMEPQICCNFLAAL